MPKRFVSEPIVACHSEVSNYRESSGGNDPQLPAAFRWREQTLEIKAVRDRRRSTKVDRGDTYLKRHWYEIETNDGRVATVYFDRAAKRGQARWWLYSIDEEC